MKAHVIKLTYIEVFKKDKIVVVTLVFVKDSTYLSSHVNPTRILINSELVFIKAAGQE